eukprot:TRINITY_DN3548_c0_g1_i1.p1 TRINITY_DN3548_c0_g1~~TRINITY_DN3548_c0_g1_i1.p1  ORF type:complete len:229 (+),score=46.28 TRINITY_DN3548_c0_g1_i1:278-964(+)
MEQLLKQLSETFEADLPDKKQAIKDILWAYQQSGNEDWKKYMFWNPHKYSRNLIEITPQFEAILLCWNEGQESPIHDHAGQDCWFIVLEGPMEEVPYYLDPKTRTLTEGEASVFNAGEASWISDHVCLHKVRPAASASRGITLHIYSKPIPCCNIFCAITGEVQKRKCGFFTVRGQKSGADCTCYRELYASLDSKESSAYKDLFTDHLDYFSPNEWESKDQLKSAGAY